MCFFSMAGAKAQMWSKWSVGLRSRLFPPPVYGLPFLPVGGNSASSAAPLGLGRRLEVGAVLDKAGLARLADPLLRHRCRPFGADEELEALELVDAGLAVGGGLACRGAPSS